MKKAKKALAASIMFALTGIILSSCNAGTLSNVLSTIGSGGTVANVFSSVIGMDKLTQQGLVGSWSYKGLCCAGASEDLLAKAGGGVGATKIEQ